MCISLFLVNVPIHLRGSARHIYVEVFLHEEPEGKFLEDWEPHCEETMGQISKLGGFWRFVVGRKADCSPYRNLQSTGPILTLIERRRILSAM